MLKRKLTRNCRLQNFLFIKTTCFCLVAEYRVTTTKLLSHYCVLHVSRRSVLLTTCEKSDVKFEWPLNSIRLQFGTISLRSPWKSIFRGCPAHDIKWNQSNTEVWGVSWQLHRRRLFLWMPQGINVHNAHCADKENPSFQLFSDFLMSCCIWRLM
jgi:hypothetical protein